MTMATAVAVPDTGDIRSVWHEVPMALSGRGALNELYSCINVGRDFCLMYHLAVSRHKIKH